MRSRIVILLTVVLALAAAAGPASIAHAQVSDPGGAGQEEQGGDPTGADDAGAGQEEQDADGAGQSDPDAETGAGADEQAGGAEATGPPWTYQMARISIFLLFLLALGIFLAYRKLVMSRQRAGI